MTSTYHKGVIVKSLISITALGGTVLTLVVVLASQGAAQAPPSSRAWSYAYVYDGPGDLEMAYAEPDGCRIEKIAVDPASAFGNRDPDGRYRRSRAVAKAIRMLGDNGWEMVGAGPMYCHYRSTGAPDVIHFKRAQ